MAYPWRPSFHLASLQMSVPYKGNFEMTVLKTKQFNGIQFGSVRPHFFDYNYIGDTTKTVDAQFISHCAFQSGNRNLLM